MAGALRRRLRSWFGIRSLAVALAILPASASARAQCGTSNLKVSWSYYSWSGIQVTATMQTWTYGKPYILMGLRTNATPLTIPAPWPLQHVSDAQPSATLLQGLPGQDPAPSRNFRHLAPEVRDVCGLPGGRSPSDVPPASNDRDRQGDWAISAAGGNVDDFAER